MGSLDASQEKELAGKSFQRCCLPIFPFPRLSVILSSHHPTAETVSANLLRTLNITDFEFP